MLRSGALWETRGSGLAQAIDTVSHYDLRSALPAWSVRREYPSCCGNAVVQGPSELAAPTVGGMRLRAPARFVHTRLNAGAANRVPAANRWCADQCPRRSCPAFRAGAWVAELRHRTARRERPANLATKLIVRHGSLTHKPIWGDRGRAERASAHSAALSGGGLQHHLGPALIPIVEVLVGAWRLLKRQLMRDDE